MPACQRVAHVGHFAACEIRPIERYDRRNVSARRGGRENIIEHGQDAICRTTRQCPTRRGFENPGRLRALPEGYPFDGPISFEYPGTRAIASEDRRVEDPDIRLDEVGECHADAMLRWMSDPAVRENVGVREAPSLDRTLAWIRNARTDPSVAAFAVVLEGSHVGNVILDRIERDAGIARLSVYIGDAATRGRGVGRRAVGALLDHAFDTLMLHKVYLTVHEKNPAAITAYLAAGFRIEGVHRAEFQLREERINVFYMGIMRADRSSPEDGSRA